MVNTDRALESEWVTPELVENSVTKRAIILTEGTYEPGRFGLQLTLIVEMDGRQRKYSPNKDTVRALRQAYGLDSASWVQKVVAFQVVPKSNGKKSILGSNGIPGNPPLNPQPPLQMTQGGYVR